MPFFIGVDVGTGSARAGVFDAEGNLLGSASKAITTRKPFEDYAEQSSSEIWSAICECVQRACEQSDVDKNEIKGIGFDATCSLVVIGQNNEPVTVSPTGDDDWNIIVWMDHRAISDAVEINELKGCSEGRVLDYVGGVISPEMEVPKLRWLKREMPESWGRAAAFFDLPDWLVFRATGSDVRSLCSTVCKWTYRGHEGLSGEGWDREFFKSVGLSELANESFASLGQRFAAPGDKVGSLSKVSATELGIPQGIAVAASLIDAYSGALGTLGVALDRRPLEGRLAMIAGTSSCHIALSQSAAFVPGVWGPYFSVLLDTMWANEAGQSAAGALIDRVIGGHAASVEASQLAAQAGISIFSFLDSRLTRLAEEAGVDTALLSSSRHVQPDFHGNRSPLADPHRRGAVVGLSLEHGIDDLGLDYLATLQALAYGTRHIIEEMRTNGVPVDTLVVSGGLAQNQLFLREHADACGCVIIVPDQTEPVLAGSAMLGAVSAGQFADLPAAMAAMSGGGTVIDPRDGEIADYHDRKYRVFRKMQEDFATYAQVMNA